MLSISILLYLLPLSSLYARQQRSFYFFFLLHELLVFYFFIVSFLSLPFPRTLSLLPYLHYALCCEENIFSRNYLLVNWMCVDFQLHKPMQLRVFHFLRLLVACTLNYRGMIFFFRSASNLFITKKITNKSLIFVTDFFACFPPISHSKTKTFKFSSLFQYFLCASFSRFWLFGCRHERHTSNSNFFKFMNSIIMSIM